MDRPGAGNMQKWIKLAGLAFLLVLMPAWADIHGEAMAAMDYAYHGNKNSRIYHNSGCRYFWCKACTVGFRTAQEAMTRGFRPCKVCGG